MAAYRSTPEYIEWDRKRQSSKEYKEQVNTRQKSQQHHEYQRKYRQRPEVKAKNAERHRARKNNDIQFRLGQLLRARLYGALKNKTKAGSAVKDLGCSVNELKKHLQSLWQEGMSWDNYGKGPGKWQIDHIKELRFFDLTNREQFLIANHYSNLQPMWYEDHIEKLQKTLKG